MEPVEMYSKNWRDLIRPSGIVVDEANEGYGKFWPSLSNVVLVSPLATLYAVFCCPPCRGRRLQLSASMVFCMSSRVYRTC